MIINLVNAYYSAQQKEFNTTILFFIGIFFKILIRLFEKGQVKKLGNLLHFSEILIRDNETGMLMKADFPFETTIQLHIVFQ